MGTDADPRWLDESQQRHWRSFLGGTTALMQRLDRDLREEHQLSLPEYEVLVRLSESEGRQMRMAELASSAALSRSRLTHTVMRLEKAGVVRREACDDDGRGVLAVLTDVGLDRLREAARTHLRGVREYFIDQLSPAELKSVGVTTERVRSALGGKTF